MDFLKGPAHMQKSVYTLVTFFRLVRASIELHSHKREVRGFSKDHGILRRMASRHMRHAKRVRLLARFTLCCKAADRAGSPQGQASLLSGGGPLPRSRMREKVWQGSATWNPMMSPPREPAHQQVLILAQSQVVGIAERDVPPQHL